MKDLDQKIEQALKDATGSVDTGDEATMLQDLAATFRGQYRGLFILASIKAFAIVCLGIWSVYEFFVQTSIQAQIGFATLLVLCVMTLATIYSFVWISINKNMTNREIKRLELQVALLNNKLEARS